MDPNINNLSLKGLSEILYLPYRSRNFLQRDLGKTSDCNSHEISIWKKYCSTIFTLTVKMASDPPSEKPHTKEFSSSKPEAEYQEILQNPDIFFQKLKAFHSSHGTKFRIPTMGGNRLDLHLLFVEVTSRGGIEKVLRDRRWKEIIGVFNFPSSVTNASFVLRKYYLSLLYHFEQIYYLRKEEPSVSVSANKSSNGFTLSHSLNSAAPNQVLASPDLVDSSLVTGTIDGKFDDGYLITVNLGSEELKGVLYHIPTSPNTSQGVGISCDAAPDFHKKYHARGKGIGDGNNIGKLWS